MMTMLCHFSGEAPDTEKYSDSDFVSANSQFTYGRNVYICNISNHLITVVHAHAIQYSFLVI